MSPLATSIGRSFLINSSKNRSRVSGITTDSNFSSVSLLLHFDGSDGSRSFTDSSSNNFPMASNSSAAALTTSDYKFGTASLLIDRNLPNNSPIAYVNSGFAAAFNFGGGDFTIESWINIIDTSGDWSLVTASGSGLFFGYNNSQAIKGWSYGIRNPDSYTYTSGVTAVTGTWYHVALCRNSGNMRIFVDGVQAGTTQIDNTSYSMNNQSPAIGPPGYFGSGVYGRYKVDEFRITKGVGRYTSNFTPPTAPFPNS